jgi:hypothetical protein
VGTVGKDGEYQVVNVFVADYYQINWCRSDDGSHSPSVLTPRHVGWEGCWLLHDY